MTQRYHNNRAVSFTSLFSNSHPVPISRKHNSKNELLYMSYNELHNHNENSFAINSVNNRCTSSNKKFWVFDDNNIESGEIEAKKIRSSISASRPSSPPALPSGLCHGLSDANIDFFQENNSIITNKGVQFVPQPLSYQSNTIKITNLNESKWNSFKKPQITPIVFVTNPNQPSQPLPQSFPHHLSKYKTKTFSESTMSSSLNLTQPHQFPFLATSTSGYQNQVRKDFFPALSSSILLTKYDRNGNRAVDFSNDDQVAASGDVNIDIVNVGGGLMKEKLTGWKKSKKADLQLEGIQKDVKIVDGDDLKGMNNSQIGKKQITSRNAESSAEKTKNFLQNDYSILKGYKKTILDEVGSSFLKGNFSDPLGDEYRVYKKIVVDGLRVFSKKPKNKKSKKSLERNKNIGDSESSFFNLILEIERLEQSTVKFEQRNNPPNSSKNTPTQSNKRTQKPKSNNKQFLSNNSDSIPKNDVLIQNSDVELQPKVGISCNDNANKFVFQDDNEKSSCLETWLEIEDHDEEEKEKKEEGQTAFFDNDNFIIENEQAPNLILDNLISDTKVDKEIQPIEPMTFEDVENTFVMLSDGSVKSEATINKYGSKEEIFYKKSDYDDAFKYELDEYNFTAEEEEEWTSNRIIKNKPKKQTKIDISWKLEDNFNIEKRKKRRFKPILKSHSSIESSRKEIDSIFNFSRRLFDQIEINSNKLSEEYDDDDDGVENHLVSLLVDQLKKSKRLIVGGVGGSERERKGLDKLKKKKKKSRTRKI